MTKTVENVTVKRISWVIWILTVGLLAILGSAFSHAWRLNRELQDELAVLEPMLTASWEQQATLQAELAYVKSDAYVEEWARVHAGMTQPGETLVVVKIPTATPTPTPMPTVTPTPSPTPQYFWQRWWQTLTGKTP